MVEVGSLEIGGSIDTEDIESGLNRIERGFDDIESKSSGVNADFSRMASTGKVLNSVLAGLGIVGAGSLLALAKNSPAVASSMAQIEVETGNLERSLGRGLAPVFDLAADAFSGFVDIIQENEGNINAVSTIFSETIRQSWDDAGTVFGFVGDKIKELGNSIGINEKSIKGFFESDFFNNFFGNGIIGFGFPDILGTLADLIRGTKETENADNRRTTGQMLRDWN